MVLVWTPGIGPIRAGALYPQPAAEPTLGHRTWSDFLAEQQPGKQQPAEQQTAEQQTTKQQTAEQPTEAD